MAKMDDDDWLDEETARKSERSEKKEEDDDFFSEDRKAPSSFDDSVDEDGPLDDSLDDDFEEDGPKERKKKVFKNVEDASRLRQFEGMVTVLKRDSSGKPLELAFDVGQVQYPIVMDKMGQQLLKFCYTRLFVGAQIKQEGEVKLLLVKNFV